MSATASQRDEIRTAAREVAERSAREQGLPAKVTDRATLESVAAILRDRKQDAA